MDLKEEIVKKFWKALDDLDFDLAESYMDPNATIIWPNTNEVFNGRNNFILTQKNYPGVWRIILEELISLEDKVISIVKVKAKDGPESVYAVSFFEFKDKTIIKIIEYWGDVLEPPEWRIKGGWSERYR